jgi:hypothetical protein
MKPDKCNWFDCRLEEWVFSKREPAHVAQSVEHILGKDEVTSSILVVGSTRL